MKIKFNDFYKKGGYSNPFRYFESSTFKQAEEKTEIDAFSEVFGIQKNNSGIPSFLSSNPNENPNLPKEKKEINEEEEEVRNILRSSKNLKEADLFQFSAYKDALDNGAKGVSKEDFFTLVKLKEEYAKSLKELNEQQSKKIVPRTPEDPMINMSFAAVTEGMQQNVGNRNLLSPLQKQIDEILKPALEYIQEKNNKAKFSFYKTNPEMEELRKKIGNGGMRFFGTTFNVAKTVKDLPNLLNPITTMPSIVTGVTGTELGIRKFEKDLQMKMNTAKLFEKTDYELSYALNKNKTFLSNFIQGGYSGGNDLLTLGIDGIATNVEVSKLRNKDPKTYTEEEKHFLNAWDQRQNFESMNVMGDAFGYTLGKGLVENLSFMIPMGASAKTVGKVGNVVAKLGAVKSGRIANTFWKKANQALYKFLEKSSQVAVGTLMQPMTYDKTLEKYTENIEIVKDKNGNDQYLVDDKTRREYFKEAEKDIAIYLNELQIYQNSLSDPTLPEILRKDLEEKIKYKEAQINSTYSNMSRIAVKNEETGELEPLKDSSLGRSFAYGFMFSAREYFTETIGGDLIIKSARGIGRTKPFRRIGVSTRTTNAQINNLLTNAAKGKGIGKLFESLSKHSGIGRIWHGVPVEVGEEVLNQFIPVMDENLLENIKQLGTFNWWRDVISQTVLMGGVMVGGAKIAEKMSLYSLSEKDREEYLNKVKKDRNHKKELKRDLQDILLKANAEIKDKKTADVISMITHSTAFNEKEAIENLTSLRAKGLNAEADYLQSKLMMNLGLEAFENGLLENYLTSLRKSSSAYKSQIKISPNESDIKGKEKVDRLISSLEQLQKTASKYENKINFDNIVHAAKRKLNAEITLEEFNSQMSKIIKDNAKDFKEYQESLPLDSPLRLADLNSLTINDENSHNLLVELANAGKAEANRLLKLRFFQAMVLSDYNEASKDFAYETNPINYEEIEKRTENERIKAEILRSNTKEKQEKLRRELKQRKSLTPWLNSVLVSQESGNPLSTATIDKIIGLPSLIESVSLLKQEKEIAVSELNTEESLQKELEHYADIELARSGDKEMIDRFNKYGISYEKTTLRRFVSEGEVESVLRGEKQTGRFKDGRVDVTASDDVSTAATAEYKITFKDKFDFNKADIAIGKIPNTEYEVKADGVYHEGKKLDNSENLSYKELIEADIKRRRQEEEVSFYSEGVDTEIKVGGIGEDRIAYSINVNEKVDIADNELGVFNTISLSQEESDKLKNMKNIAGVVNTLKLDDSYIKDAYEIGFTNVFESQRGKGIGEKAIKNIGENLSKNGYTLVSDDSRSDAAEKMWARLETKGLAKKIPSKIQVEFGDIEIDGLDERARYIYQYVPINAKYDAELAELNKIPVVFPKTVSPSGAGEVISEADYTPVDESGPFELFFGGKNLTSPVLDTEEDENNFIDAYVEIIKSHAVSFKRKAKTNSLIHEKDFTFKSFMLELYRSYYKNKPSTLLENFDLFEEAWKKAGVNVESLSIADLVFEELQNEAQGDLMLKAASFLESKTEEKEVPTEEELQEKNDESQEKVEKQETEEIFEESKEIRRAYKIPFLGQFYEAFIDKIKGIITKHDTGVLNEEAFFFLNPKNLPIGKKVQIKLTNNWMNPNATVSDWEELTSESGRPMSVRKDITMREFVEGLFNNKYKFDQIIKDKNLTEELFKNERFISKVPIDLVVGEETFPGRGLHDIFWWNYETVSNDERERLERATIEAQSQDRILSEQEKDDIRKSARIAQELKIREVQKKLLALRKALFENKDKKLSMKVSKREIGHILQNPAKIRNGKQVVVENDKKENIVLKEVKSIEESNPTTILCIYTKGGLKTKKGNKDFYIPTKYVSNFEELQRGLSENYKKSMGDGAIVMVFQVGTQEVFNEDENRTEIVPKYIASQVYSNAIEAQPFLNSLFETISVIDKAFSYPSTFDSKTLDTLIDEIIRKYGINLRNKEQRDQFRNLFPEKIRKPVTEEELAKNPNARGEVVNALKKDGIYVEKGTPGAIEEKGTPLLRYDIKTKLDRDSKIPIIVFKREDNKPNGKIIGYEITDTISYETALKRGLYTTNRFLQFKDENGEVEYVADSQPIIILSPIDKIEETGETTSTEVYIKETKNDEVEKADPVETEKLLEEAREEVTNVKKGFIVNTLVQETLIDLKTKVNTPLKLSLIYSQMNKSFDRIISELRKVDPIRAQALEENKEEILGYSEYEDSVREQLDAFFGKSQEYSDRIIKKLEKEEEDLGDSRLQESLTPEEVQENEKEEVEGIKKDHSKHSFEQNLSLGLRARTNVLLSGIVDNHPSPFSFGNMKNYYPIGHVISGLQEAFEQAEDNSLPSLLSAIKHIITKTGKLNSEYRFLEDVYNILVDTSTPTELVKEIQFLLYQSQVKMYLAYMEAREGSFKVTAMIADNKDKQILRRKIWDNTFKQNFNLIDNRGYTYTIKKEEAQRLIDIYNKWKKDFSFVPTKNELKEYLLSFGISLHDKTIEELLKGDKELSYNSLISPRGLVTVMIENLKTLKNKEILDFSKESEHVLFGNNNTNTKKLLELDSKNTFVPASSIYIAGKTVNKYEQPCHAAEILKKLNNRDRKTIENLMSCPYTKEAFILKYLMTNEDEKIDISTVSLEALKIKGHKKSTSSKKGATDLSSKDYILTLLGLFAHQGPQVDGKFGTIFNWRTSYLQFPPISDASRVLLLKTIAADLDISNFETISEGNQLIPREEVFELLYNQLVLPEYRRMVSFIKADKETGFAGYDFGANKFSAVPGLNGIIVKGGKTLLQALHDDLKNTTSPMSEEEIISKYKSEIIFELKEVLNNEAAEFAEYDPETKTIKGSFAENKIYDPLSKNPIQGIDSKYLSSKKGGTASKTIQIVAYDYALNYLLNQSQIQMLFSGDLANFYEDKNRNKFSDANGTVFRTDTKEFMLEVAKFYFPDNYKLQNLIHRYHSTKDESVKERVVQEIEDNFSSEDGHNAILNPTLKDHNAVAKSLYKTFVREKVSPNYFKRLKGILSPGSKLANSKEKQIRQICIKDVKISSQILKDLIETYYPGMYEKYSELISEFQTLDNKGEKGEYQERYDELHKMLKKAFPQIQDYLSITSTDAQELTTWQEFLDEIRDKGKVTMEVYNTIKEKLTKQSEEGYIPNEKYELTNEEMKIVFQPSKPLHAGLYYNNSNGHVAQTFVYIKSSAFPLLPSMTRNFPHLENLRRNLERIEKEEGENTNVRLSYQSANKVGSVRKAAPISLLYEKNLSDAKMQKVRESSLLLDKENYSIQQEKPSDFETQVENNEPVLNTRGTQFEKILLSNGLNKITEKIFPNIFDKEILKIAGLSEKEIKEPNVSGVSLYKILNALYKKEQDLLTKQLFRSLNIKRIEDLNGRNIELYESIVEKIKSQLSNYQDKEGLELVYYVKEDGAYIGYTKDQVKRYHLKPEFVDFDFPMWMLPNSRKFESILNSIINKNNVNPKIPGFHTIVGSQEGFKKMSEKDFTKTHGDLNKVGGMYFNPSYDGKLKATRNEEGELVGSQVLISNKFSYVKDGKRYKVDLKEYLKKDEQGNPTNQLDLERLPKEILTHFSFRIPTSAHQSGCLIEIAGFLPDNYGDLMIVPSDYTVQMGEDYDIDARNVYGLNLVEIEKEGVKYLQPESYSILKDLSLNEKEYQERELLVIQNNISNLYKSVYSTTSVDVLKKIREKLSTDTVKETSEMIYEETKQERFNSVYSPSFQMEMLRSGATGKLGIAIHSNFLTLTGLFQQMEHAISFVDLRTNEDGTKIPVPFKMVFGKHLSTEGSLQREKSINEERTVSSYHMENQNTSTDNQKLLYMFKRNENKHTINVLALMTMLGLNKDGCTIDEVEVSYSSLFISQPIIRRYCELMDYYSSETTETYQKIEQLVEDDLIKEFGVGVTWEQGTNVPMVGVLDHSIKMQKETEIDSIALFENLKSSKDNSLQWTVYEHFKTLKGKTKALSAVQKFLNIENKGMGISYFNTIALKNFLSGELDPTGETLNIETIDYYHIQGVKDMIGEFRRVPIKESNTLDKDYIYISSNGETSLFIKPTTYFGHKIVNSISLGYNMWKNLLPYESPYISNIIKDIRRTAGIEEGTEDDLDLKYQIINELKNFSYTSNASLFTDNLEEVRKGLFIDDDTNISLAGYLNYLQKINHPLMRQPFFKQLEMKIGGKDLPSVVIYNATSVSKFEKNEIRKVFKNILDNKEALPTDEKGKTYTFESLGKALLQYAMLADQENGAVGFRHMFPMSFFKKYNVTDSVRAIGNPSNVSYHNIFFNGPVKSLELLFGSKLKDGFIANTRRIPFEIVEGYVKKINNMAGKKIAVLEAKGVKILEGETEFIHSRFTTQFMQHNPDRATKVDKLFVDALKKSFKVATIAGILKFNYLDTDSNFIQIKEKNKIYLYKRKEGGLFERIPTLGLFGVNEYNFRNSEIDSSIVTENNIPTSGVQQKQALNPQIRALEAPVRTFTLETLLDTIERNNTKYGGLVKIFKKFLDKETKVEIVENLTSGNVKAHGLYDSKTNTIKIDKDLLIRNPNLEGEDIRHILEEFIHSLTKKDLDKYLKIRFFEENNKVTMSVEVAKDAPSSVIRLARIYNEAFNKLLAKEGGSQFLLDYLSKRQKISSGDDSVTLTQKELVALRAVDINEFIAGIFFDENFRELVGNEPFMESGKSIIQSWAETLLKFLQQIYSIFQEGSIGRETIDALYEFLTEGRKTVPDSFTPVKEEDIFSVTDEDKIKDQQMRDFLRLLDEEATPENNHPEILSQDEKIEPGYYFPEIKDKDLTSPVVEENTLSEKGVSELFESNPELANSVYETLGFTGNISDEQKQEAQQLYSQYLDTIFPDSKVKDIVYHGLNANMPSDFKFNLQEFVFDKSLQRKGSMQGMEEGIFFSNDKEFVQNNFTKYGLFGALLNLKNPKIKGEVEYWKDDIEYLTTQEESLGGKSQLDYLAKGIRPIAWNKYKGYEQQVEALKKDGYGIEEVDGYFIRLSKLKPMEEAYFSQLKKAIDNNAFPYHTNMAGKIIQEAIKNKQDGVIFENLLEESSSNVHNQYVVFESEQIHILGGKQDIEGFKEFVNNRTKNSTNKESLQAENLNINKDNIYETLLKEGKIENQGYTLTLEEFNSMTKEEQDNFIKCL